MIRIFKATDTNFTSNGDIVLIAHSAVITKNEDEEYIEVEAPLKYAEFLIQDNILIADTPAGKKGYRINNPVIASTISIKANICYNEYTPAPADRGVVVSYGKNLTECTVTENWDDVVTKLTPIGYKGATLQEGYLSVTTPHQLVYDKTIEFELSESAVASVQNTEDAISTYETNIAGLQAGIASLQSSITVATETISELQADITGIQAQIDALGTTKPELKQKAILESQIDEINVQITSLNTSITQNQTALTTAQADLVNAQNGLVSLQSAYNNQVQSDLRAQAQAYLDYNTYPKINYDLDAHLEGIVEIGDTIQVKHERLKIDMTAYVISYQYNCNTLRFVNVQFGTIRPSLKSRITDMQKNIKVVSEGLKNAVSSIEQLSDQIVMKVDANGHLALFKLGSDASGSQILISADMIELEGLITANKGFKILLDGSFEALAGKIAGFTVAPEDATTHEGGLIFNQTPTGKFMRISPYCTWDGNGGYDEDYGSIDLGLAADDMNTLIHLRSDGYARFGLASENGVSIRFNDFLRYDASGGEDGTDTIFHTPNFKIMRDGTVVGAGGASITSGTGTITTTGWVANTGDYGYKLDLAISEILASDYVDVSIDNDDLDTAQTASISPNNVSYDGGVTFYAKSIPTASMGFTYRRTR